MKKRYLVIGFILLFSLFASINNSSATKDHDENEKIETKEAVFEDYQIKSTRPRSTYTQIKYVGPGSVSLSEIIFTEYLAKEGWNYDYKEPDDFYNIIYFKHGSYQEHLKLTIGDYTKGETLVIVEIPYK